MAFITQGKSAIVTGAGAGINLAFAIKLLDAGVNVLFADLALTSEAEAAVAKYKDKPRAIFQKTDVSSWAELESMFKTAVKEFGNVDIVCPGAGVFEPHWSSFWYPPGSAESKDVAGNSYKLLDINLTHPIRVAQMAISHFIGTPNPASTSNPKRIVFIASVAGEIATLPFPLYHASKWGVMGFVRSLAGLDDALGIRVGAVAPGVVKTPLWLNDKTKIPMVTNKATGELQASWTTPEEVADAMMAIVKDDEVDNGKGEKLPIKSGVVLEIGHGLIRDVPMLGNTGPDVTAEGMVLADMEGAHKEVFDVLSQPGWGKALGQ